MTTVSELRSKAQTIAHQAKSILAEMEGKDESRANELETQFDRAIAEHDSLQARADKLEALEAREKALETVDPRRPTEDRVARTNSDTAITADQAFAHYIRYGDNRDSGFTAEHRNALRGMEVRDGQTTSSTAGGYLIPTTLGNKIVTSVKLSGPMMDPDSFWQINTDSGNTINFPTLDDTANTGVAIAEATAPSVGSVTLGQKPIGAFKYTPDVFKVSTELMNDAGFDVQSFIGEAMGVRLGRILNTKLTLGGGSTEPTGIVSAVGTPSLATASANTLAFDDIISLEHQVDPAYRNRPKIAFMFHDSILQAVRKLKDSQGRYLWEPSQQVGEPATIHGYKYLLNQDMSNAVSVGNVVALFGDMGSFLVRQSGNYSIRRLDELYAATDQIGFTLWTRVDSNLMDAKAVKGLKSS